jgi:cellulose synthase operon protein C
MRPPMRRIVRFAALLLVVTAVVRAQTANPSPLTSARANAATAPGQWIVWEGRANSALQSGFPATAVLLYREILRDPGLTAEARPRVTLALVTALLDTGDVAAAEAELKAYQGPSDSSYRLRAGLLAAHARRRDAARTELGEVNAGDLTAGERAWWFFLQAQIADLDNDVARANSFYAQAVQAAISEQQRARFTLGEEQARLRVAPPDESRLAGMRANVEQNQGTRLGYMYVRTYATALHALSRSAEAKATLQRALAALPATEKETADQFRLMLGLIAGEGTPEGRRALALLVRSAVKPETQRTALYLLARGSRTPADREELRRALSELISAPTLHPIIEDLRLVRAQVALMDKQYNAAEEDARLLLEFFPGSPLKPAALGVRLAVAWDLRLYRSAADLASQLRALVPVGRERAELGVLVAEAYFRAGDFKNAADAYEALLRDVHAAPQVVPTGVLIFMRVLSDIEADRIDAAAALLDEMAANPAFDVESRWQAEWNLIREMQARKQTVAAQARVEKLLATGTANVPGELRVRLLWLRAKLSFDNGAAQAAASQVDDLLAAVATAQLEPALKNEVTSTAQLLKAQALLELGRDADGAGLLDKLRADFRDSKAALFSYLVQAARQAQRGDLAGAQKTLSDMAEANRDSEFAPYALYQAALYSEQQGLDRNLQKAHELLEQLVRNYPRDELVFYARLKQGDLLRKLNDFGSARLVYEDLINNRGQHPDVLLAQLALADSLFAQGTNNVTNYESAAALYERLRDLPTAPIDLRVEAGYKWGFALSHRGRGPEAVAALWGVVDTFLIEASSAAKLGAKGRWWMSKTLLELGQQLEQIGKLDAAQRAYQLIVDNKLGGVAEATAKLARFRAPPVEAPKP